MELTFSSDVEIKLAREAKAYGYVAFMSAWNKNTNNGNKDYIRGFVAADDLGYFGSLVNSKDHKAVEGSISCYLDQHDRPVMLVSTPFGNVVIFKRYTDNGNFVITTNVPNQLCGWIPSGNIGYNEDAVYQILGDLPTNNIGHSLMSLWEDFKKVM